MSDEELININVIMGGIEIPYQFENAVTTKVSGRCEYWRTRRQSAAWSSLAVAFANQRGLTSFDTNN